MKNWQREQKVETEKEARKAEIAMENCIKGFCKSERKIEKRSNI